MTVACKHDDRVRLRVTVNEHWCGECGSIFWNGKWIAPQAITLPGWTCACGVFNGSAKERHESCRSCGVARTP